jgi:hypothetical protein
MLPLPRPRIRNVMKRIAIYALVVGLIFPFTQVARGQQAGPVKPPPSGAVAQNSSGGISANLFSSFSGRVGQLNNQPADKILAAGDLVITIGYDPVEYWPSIWNKGNKCGFRGKVNRIPEGT